MEQPEASATPIHLVLTGSPWELRYPGLCACCGAPAPARSVVAIEKVREHCDSDGPTTYSVEEIRIPFCDACARRHELEVQRVSLATRMLRCLREPVVIAGFGSSFMLYLFMPAFVENLFRADLVGIAAFGAVLAFFGWIAWGSFRTAYDKTHHLSVTPPTSVTRAFDFSGDVSDMFEGHRREYTLANAEFAEAFRFGNQARQWNPHGGAAKIAHRKRERFKKVAYVVIGAVVLWALWDDWNDE